MLKQPIPTLQLIRRLRLMADSGGMLTRDRIDAVRQAADRLEDLDERVAIMSETNTGFNTFHNLVNTGGDTE